MQSLEIFTKNILSYLEELRHPPKVVYDLLQYPLDLHKLDCSCTELEIDQFYQFTLYKIIKHLFHAYFKVNDKHLRNVIAHLIEFGKADVVFQYLLDQFSTHSFTDTEEVSFTIHQLELFLLIHKRTKSVLSMVCANASNCSTRSTNFERCARSFATLPTLIANSVRGHFKSTLLMRNIYIATILSEFNFPVENSTYSELCGIILSQLCLSGYSAEVAEVVLDVLTRNNLSHDTDNQLACWSSIFFHIKEICLESCLQPILFHSPHPHYVFVLLSQLFDTSESIKQESLFRLFRRLIFVRYFPRGDILRNMFGALYKVIDTLTDPLHKVALANRINKELGIPVLQLWADSSAIQSTSMEQNVYTSQALASWIMDFYHPLQSTLNMDTSCYSLLPDVLAGIGAHLSSPREEIRNLGMAMGEWLVGILDMTPDSESKAVLKFNYVANDAVLLLKPFFHPIPEVNSVKNETPDEKVLSNETAADPPSMSTTVDERNMLDSDDDPDPADATISALQRLPPRPKQVTGTRKPRYLRECLDGMLLTKPDENQTNLACTGAAADLIYAHPQAARELVNDFARVLIHVEPPVSPDDSAVSTNRHDALVALGVVAPKECARYLTNEFCQPTCALGQRLTILSALTDAASRLASSSQLECSRTENEKKPTVSTCVEAKTRRFCSKPVHPVNTTNAFAPYAGEFFFPLLRSIPQLYTDSQKGTFAHQDAGLLSTLLASLSTIYMCARFAPVQLRMASEVVDLIPLLYRHNEPAVRRAVLILSGTVITTTPLGVLSANPRLLFGDPNAAPTMSILPASNSDPFLPNWLKQCANADTDSECRLLARVSLSALMEKMVELSEA